MGDEIQIEMFGNMMDVPAPTMNLMHVAETEEHIGEQEYTVQDVFGFNSQIKIKGCVPGHPLVPKMAHKYVWDSKLAKDFIEWLSEDNPDPLFITGPTGCIAAETIIYDPTDNSRHTVEERYNGGKEFHVIARAENGIVITRALPPVKYHSVPMYKLTTSEGILRVTGQHRILLENGDYAYVEQLYQHPEKFASIRLQSISELDLLAHVQDALDSLNKPQGFNAPIEINMSTISRTNITSIELEGSEVYYDFTVPAYENYWASGLFHHNCGKTDAPKSVFAALNIPTVLVSAKSSTEPDDILGRTQLRDGNTIFVPGDLLRAYERGYAIIFDEIDGYNPEVVMAMHRLLERDIIVLDDGTVIRPAAKNLIVATANTRGDGHGGDVYAATKVLNMASLNRFEKWEMTYPPENVEIKILQDAFGSTLDEKLIVAMVQTASDIRRAYMDGNCPGPISIRDMLRWGRKLKHAWNRKDVSPIFHSFDKSFGNGVDAYVRQMLHTLIQTRFGVPSPSILGVS